jgi:hypothetical protein
MKKNFLTGFTGMFLLLVISVSSNGQLGITNGQLSGDLTSFEKSAVKIESGEVSQKAVRDLAKSFKNVSGENWYGVKDGFVAMFDAGDIQYQVSYDKKGNWLFTIRSYRESTLPDDIRHMVKSSYYDYSINLVQEVERPVASKAYIIQLVGKTDLLKLKIFDGEMQVLERLNKSE